jgi:hypothetical protein
MNNADKHGAEIAEKLQNEVKRFHNLTIQKDGILKKILCLDDLDERVKSLINEIEKSENKEGSNSKVDKMEKERQNRLVNLLQMKGEADQSLKQDLVGHSFCFSEFELEKIIKAHTQLRTNMNEDLETIDLLKTENEKLQDVRLRL